jgi:outer membrane protein TolC
MVKAVFQIYLAKEPSEMKKYIFITKRIAVIFTVTIIALLTNGVVANAADAVASDGKSILSRPVELSLGQALSLALRANRGVISSEDAVAAREWSLKAAESEFEIKLVPGVDAAVSGAEDDSDDEAGFGVEGAVEKKFSYGPTGAVTPRVEKAETGDYTSGIGVSLSVPLFRRFGREVNMDSVDSASFSLRESMYSRYLTRDRTALDTVAAVYAVIRQEELLDLFAGQIERYQGHVDAARVKEKAGLVGPIDVYRAEISLKDAQDNLNRTRKALADARDRLKLILAMPLELNVRVTAPVDFNPVDLDQDKALDIALSNRMELKRAGDRVENALRKSRIAKQGIWPEFRLEMDYERVATSEDFRQSVELNEDNWSVALIGGTSWPRSAEKAAYQQSLLAVKTARLGMQQDRDDIVRDVRAELDALKEAGESVTIREEQIRSAEGKLALAQVKFRYGMADNFDVIESENELARAKVDLLTARTDYIVGVYRLRSALGTLIETNGFNSASSKK